MSLFKLLTMPEKNLMTQKQLHGKQKEKSGLIIISAVLNRHLDVNKKNGLVMLSIVSFACFFQ